MKHDEQKREQKITYIEGDGTFKKNTAEIDERA